MCAELGIDIGGILKRTRAVLLHQLNARVLEELDMGGALIFIFVLGGLHLLVCWGAGDHVGEHGRAV